MRNETQKQLAISHSNTLVSVTFTNDSMGGQRAINVYHTVKQAQKDVKRLKKMAHISNVEVVVAIVKEHK